MNTLFRFVRIVSRAGCKTCVDFCNSPFLTNCCFSNVGVLVAFYIERFPPKLVPGKDTLRVRHRGTTSSDTPVVTGFGEGARQKILIHQVFDRSVKDWARCEGLFYPHVPCP